MDAEEFPDLALFRVKAVRARDGQSYARHDV